MLRSYVFRKRSPTTAAAPEHSKYGKMDIRDGRALHVLDVEEFWLNSPPPTSIASLAMGNFFAKTSATKPSPHRSGNRAILPKSTGARMRAVVR